MTGWGIWAAVIAVIREDARTAAVSSSGVLPVRVVARLRQLVTRSRSGCTCLSGRVARVTCWRRRATTRTGKTPEELTAAVLASSRMTAMTAAQIPQPVIDHLADHTVAQVMTRRSTWTPWNVLAEAARATRGLRVATAQDRQVLLERVSDAVLAGSVRLDPPDLFPVQAEYQRPDGTSVFSRPGETRY